MPGAKKIRSSDRPKNSNASEPRDELSRHGPYRNNGDACEGNEEHGGKR